MEPDVIKAKKKLRGLKLFTYFIIAIIAFTGFRMITWIVFTPSQALTITKLPVPVVRDIAQPGQYVTLNISFCKNIETDGKVTSTLVSKRTQLVLPISYDRGKKGCYTHTQVPLPIPPQATPDTYHYHFHTVYTVNPLRTLTSDFDTASFKVQ